MSQLVAFAILFQLLFHKAIAYEKVECPKVSKDITDSIFFLYYIGPTVNDYYRVHFQDGLSIWVQKSFNKNIKTVLYLPGWGEQPSNHEESTDTIAAAFLKKYVANLIIVDYYELVKSNNLLDYVSSVGNISSIGEALACYLHKVIPAVQSITNIHLVGHSLGGQIMSRTANAYGKGKLVWLTGLDPAGPLFNIPFIQNSLSKEDGKFVDCIHTDAYFYGEGRSVGHADFFPNKGTRIQPYCMQNNSAFCSHHMSWRYYAASVEYETIFPAQSCDVNIFFIDKSVYCKKDAIVELMGYGVNTTSRGNFYLKTGSKYPFGLGKNGFYSEE